MMKAQTHIGLKELAGYLKLPATHLVPVFEELGLGHQVPVAMTNDVLFKIKEREGLKNRSWELPESLLNDSSAWAQALVALYREPVSFPASLAPPQGAQLRDMILALKPRVVVEIGCYIGVSTLWVAQALETLGGDRQVHSADLFYAKFPVPPFYYNYLHAPQMRAEQALRDAGLGHRSNFYRCLSKDFARRFPSLCPKPIDFIFIDGDHSEGGCLDDFISFYPLLPVGAQILSHDIHPAVCNWKGPRYVLDRIIGSRPSFKVEEIDTEPNYGMALITKLKDDPRFHPGGDPEITKVRRAHRLKAAVGFSPFYQYAIKPLVQAWKGNR